MDPPGKEASISCPGVGSTAARAVRSALPRKPRERGADRGRGHVLADLREADRREEHPAEPFPPALLVPLHRPEDRSQRRPARPPARLPASPPPRKCRGE